MDHAWKKRVKNMSVCEQWGTLYKEKKKIQGNHSVWGPGNVFRNSAKLVDLLPGILKELNITSFVDVGCGDFMWLSKLNWNDIRYTGLDIVADLIAENKKNYPEFEFDTMNLIEETPPKADIIFARSVFIHTSFKDCKSMIKNFKASDSKYLMASTLPHVENNVDTSCLWLRKLNLQIEPFNFPEPLYLVPEIMKAEVNNYMGVWSLDSIW